jgi:hypothetical protein
LVGQGATEYLVLLAVVLIVALVSVALLGFFPGMASDAQMTQSQTYWRGASPIAIVESASAFRFDGEPRVYLLLRNTGAYPIRITGVIGNDGLVARQIWRDDCGFSGAVYSISDYFYLAPGEEKYFNAYLGPPCKLQILLRPIYSTGGQNVKVDSTCQNSSVSPGMVIGSGFGFEYAQYTDGQTITKKQIGAKPLMIKCKGAF